jgi:hypothetical protein
MNLCDIITKKFKFGATSRDRTCDLGIRSLSLYPTELWLHITIFSNFLITVKDLNNPPEIAR